MAQKFDIAISVNDEGRAEVKMTKGHGEDAGKVVELRDYQIGFRLPNDFEVNIIRNTNGQSFAQGKVTVPAKNLDPRVQR